MYQLQYCNITKITYIGPEASKYVYIESGVNYPSESIQDFTSIKLQIEYAYCVLQYYARQLNLPDPLVILSNENNKNCGLFISGSETLNPFIILFPVTILSGIHFELEIEVTLLHELAHAYIASTGMGTAMTEDIEELICEEFGVTRNVQQLIQTIDQYSKDYQQSLNIY